MASSNVGTSPKVEPEPDDDADEAASPPTEEADPPTPVDLPLDEVFGLLTNRRRRRVLKILAERDGPIRLGDLAEQIAALENDKSIAQIDSKERKSVYVGLYQVHLPKMDGMDVVEFNKPRGIIERGRNAHVFDDYLERAEADPGAESRPWHQYHAGLSTVGAVVLGLAMWVQPQTALPVTVIAVTGVVAALCGCAIAQCWSNGDGHAADAVPDGSPPDPSKPV